MKISLLQVGKKYRFEWIFKEINFEFQSGEKYALLGPNGSGKSTLMKVLSGHLSPSKGQIIHSNPHKIKVDTIYQQLSYAAPYMDLIEEFSLKEAIQFHQKFKPFLAALSVNDVFDHLGLSKKNKDKEIRFFSSGMKQRLKLTLAILSDTDLILLDEPTTNLDVNGMEWYLSMMEKFMKNRTVIVASNEERDYGFCNQTINIMDYKS